MKTKLKTFDQFMNEARVNEYDSSRGRGSSHFLFDEIPIDQVIMDYIDDMEIVNTDGEEENLSVVDIIVELVNSSMITPKERAEIIEKLSR